MSKCHRLRRSADQDLQAKSVLYSKKSLIAALVKKSKVHVDIFRTPSSGPASSSFPSNEIQSSLGTFVSPFLAKVSATLLRSVPHRLVSQAPLIIYSCTICSTFQILLSVRQAFQSTPAFAPTRSTLDLSTWNASSGRPRTNVPTQNALEGCALARGVKGVGVTATSS